MKSNVLFFLIREGRAVTLRNRDLHGDRDDENLAESASFARESRRDGNRYHGSPAEMEEILIAEFPRVYELPNVKCGSAVCMG